MITYYDLLELFKKGISIDETTFYFKDDPIEEEHYIGYLPEYSHPYWAGYCDIKDGCDFHTAEELFNAPIYDGKSIKERYEQLILITIGGCPINDWDK